VLSAEPAPRHARLAAVVTGTAGLLAVGFVLMTITPDRAEVPVAIGAATSAISAAPISTVANSDAVAPSAVRPLALAPPPSLRDRGATLGPLSAPRALATPIGDGRFGLVTRAALAPGQQDSVDVRLPSGRTSIGEIVTGSEHAVVVALADAEPGHAVATEQPNATDIVTVMASPPVTIAYAEAHTVPVDEGVAVLDEHGNLVGICTRQADSDDTLVIEVAGELDDATSVVP